ncbi:glycine cleavage system protein T [Rhodobacteraceae bacterium NNCM2]|nr:glycine cleavage system protein T [Coraliihabitans acroporae]
MAFEISPTPRVRRSPFFEATVADGVVSFSTYNHMLMPTGYGDPMAEYWRLIEGVAMWDVAVERQVEVTGPDAARLVQILCPRKLDKLTVGTGWYVAICDHRGTIINDPILLKLAEDRYWFSIADGDLALFARAVAAERGLDVTINEPDVAPLAIQGPKAEDVVADLLGDEIRDIRHFRFREMMLDDISLIVARSGWSKQGGFELYLIDPSRGGELWERVKQAGQPYGIGPGCPNPMERVESGLLSWGGDTDDETNPFEVRMERYVHLDAPDDVVGIQALRRIWQAGPARHQMGVTIHVEGKLGSIDMWSQIVVDNTAVGHVTAHSWSPRLEANIGLCLIDRSVIAGDNVTIRLADGREATGEICELPFL